MIFAACAQRVAESAETAMPPSAACDVYGYQRDSEDYRQCAIDVDRAMSSAEPRAPWPSMPMPSKHTFRDYGVPPQADRRGAERGNRAGLGPVGHR